MNLRIWLATITLMACVAATSHATVMSPSNGGNSLLHAIGWQTFDNAGGNNNSGISDNTPDSNSTFDATPFGSHAAVSGGGQYLTGIIGVGASNLGRAGFGQNTANNFLNGPTFGSGTVGSAPFGIDIEDVPLADGSAGSRIGPQGQAGTSSWKFQTNGNQEFGDFSITNESDYAFRLERLHYDARAGAANSPMDLDLIYLAGGASNLIRVSTGTEVPDLHVFSDISFASAPSTQNVSQSVAASFNQPTAVRLAPGDTASFRFRWTNSVTDFAQSQIDNLAISGTFLDQNNGFTPIDPAAVVPEPASAALLLLGVLTAIRMKR
ncbi:MAG: PEP-CTERM sorting domain-containing protein [Pseudomonadota bacterium]